MRIEQLRNTIRASPFRPFTVHVADGRTFHVPHPDFVVQSPAGRTVILFDSAENESFSIVDLLLVTELEVGATVSKPDSDPKSNGT
jgi:hypothetical protein